MMTEADLIRLIKQVVRKEFAQILMATTTGSDNSYVTSMRRFVTDSEIDGLRIISPYGYASRPPDGTECVVAPINSDPSHLVILGQFDNGNRPTILPGESALYGPDGQLIRMETGGDITFTKYIPLTGTVLPTYLGKISQDGTVTFHNIAGAKMELDPLGSATLGNLIGSVKVSVTGMVQLDGGGGASHGVGLGDIIESRLTALEIGFATFLIGDLAHTHLLISPAPGSPTGPPVPPPVPFVPVPIPAASFTAMVST